MFLLLQLSEQIQFGLEINVVGEFQMRDKTCRFDVIRVRQHKLFVLRRAFNRLAVVGGLQGAVDQRHRHRFAFAHAEHQPVAAGKVWRLIMRCDKAIDHFAFGYQQFADVDRKTQLFRHDFHIDIPAADLTGERVIAPVTALSGVGERQQVTLIAARQLLQT